MSHPNASRLKVRKIDFQFPDDIAWQWCPQNPGWGNCVNYASVIGPAFERYFIRAFRQAMPLITDERLRDDAELFCQQEAQHSRQHIAHLAMLTRKYPGLEEARLAVLASYEELLATKDLKFHLAYTACIELMFGPVARFVVENREQLMAGSDSRIASFMLWHLVEEFEHRNSAYDVYNHVVGSYGYRLKTFPKMALHMYRLYRLTADAFARHIPESDWDATGPVDTSTTFKGIPLTSLLHLFYELFCTLLPWHKPDRMRQPDWVSQWFADEAAGVNMAQYFPQTDTPN